MFQCYQLQSALSVIDHWSFIRSGVSEAARANRLKPDYELALKIMCTLATSTSGFVAVVTKGDELEGFGALEELTPCFSPAHNFLCRLFWHKSGNVEATTTLMRFFEDWASVRGVKSYMVTTSRGSGNAIRCFKSPKYGFKRSFTTFIKDL